MIRKVYMKCQYKWVNEVQVLICDCFIEAQVLLEHLKIFEENINKINIIQSDFK